MQAGFVRQHENDQRLANHKLQERAYRHMHARADIIVGGAVHPHDMAFIGVSGSTRCMGRLGAEVLPTTAFAAAIYIR
jgi:hypothetical protein